MGRMQQITMLYIDIYTFGRCFYSNDDCIEDIQFICSCISWEWNPWPSTILYCLKYCLWDLTHEWALSAHFILLNLFQTFNNNWFYIFVACFTSLKLLWHNLVCIKSYRNKCKLILTWLSVPAGKCPNIRKVFKSILPTLQNVSVN